MENKDPKSFWDNPSKEQEAPDFESRRDEAKKALAKEMLKIKDLDTLSQNDILDIAKKVYKKTQERELPQSSGPVGDYEQSGEIWDAETALEKTHEDTKKGFDLIIQNFEQNKLPKLEFAGKARGVLQKELNEILIFFKKYGTEDINTSLIKNIVLESSQYAEALRNVFVAKYEQIFKDPTSSKEIKLEAKNKTFDALRSLQAIKVQVDEYISKNPEIIEKLPELKKLSEELDPKKASQRLKNVA